SLQSAALDLSRQRATDSLKKSLSARPPREDLIERNILTPSTAAPAIQGHARELEKSMKADALNEKIAHRPAPEELVKEGILREDPTSPEGEGDAGKKYEEAMEEEYAKREGGA
ncbi:MKL/myocardin-like protein, partial [Lachnellula subtilissima]